MVEQGKKHPPTWADLDWRAVDPEVIPDDDGPPPLDHWKEWDRRDKEVDEALKDCGWFKKAKKEVELIEEAAEQKEGNARFDVDHDIAVVEEEELTNERKAWGDRMFNQDRADRAERCAELDKRIASEIERAKGDEEDPPLNFVQNIFNRLGLYTPLYRGWAVLALTAVLSLMCGGNPEVNAVGCCLAFVVALCV